MKQGIAGLLVSPLKERPINNRYVVSPQIDRGGRYHFFRPFLELQARSRYLAHMNNRNPDRRHKIKLPWLFCLAVWALVLQLSWPVQQIHAAAGGEGFWPICYSASDAASDEGVATGSHDCPCCFAGSSVAILAPDLLPTLHEAFVTDRQAMSALLSATIFADYAIRAPPVL